MVKAWQDARKQIIFVFSYIKSFHGQHNSEFLHSVLQPKITKPVKWIAKRKLEARSVRHIPVCMLESTYTVMYIWTLLCFPWRAHTSHINCALMRLPLNAAGILGTISLPQLVMRTGYGYVSVYHKFTLHQVPDKCFDINSSPAKSKYKSSHE